MMKFLRDLSNKLNRLTDPKILMVIGKAIIATIITFLILYIITPNIQSSSAEIIKYSDIKDTLKTGDLILLTDQDLDSLYIRTFTWCPVSHTAMVLRLPESTAKSMGLKETLFLVESNVGSKIDIISGEKGKWGPAIVSLEEKVKNEPLRNIALLRLNNTLDSDQVLQIAKDNSQFGFDNQFKNWFYAVYDGPYGNSNKLTFKHQKYFCSEYIAFILQKLDVLNKSIPSSEYLPCNFMDLSPNVLTAGYSYSRPIYFKA